MHFKKNYFNTFSNVFYKGKPDPVSNEQTVSSQPATLFLMGELAAEHPHLSP